MSLNSLHTKVGSGTVVTGSGESDLNVQCVAMYTYDFPTCGIFRCGIFSMLARFIDVPSCLE